MEKHNTKNKKSTKRNTEKTNNRTEFAGEYSIEDCKTGRNRANTDNER